MRTTCTPVENTLITLLIHWCCHQKTGVFIKETAIHRCNIDETLMISMQTLMIINIFYVLIFETLMFHFCFIDDSLMFLWRNIDETAKISMKTLKIINVFNGLIWETAMFHWWFVDESSGKHWWFRWKHWKSFMITNSPLFQNIDVSYH